MSLHFHTCMCIELPIVLAQTNLKYVKDKLTRTSCTVLSLDRNMNDLNEVSLHAEALLERSNRYTLNHAHPIIAHTCSVGTI